MANENFKTINTRIALRTGDFAYWTTGAGKDIELIKGEVCVCTVAAADNQATTAPTVLLKVCDTTGKKFADLKWMSGLAADVYAWAKKEAPDWTDFPALPLQVIDNETGKFVTDFEYANNKLTIHRADAVNSLAANDDDVVVLSVDKSTGDVTVTGEHAKKGPTNGYTGGQATDEINAFGDSITIKVPKLTVDAYGHTNAAEDVEYKITLPTPEAATNTVTLLTEGAGIDIEELATDGNHNYKVSHEDTSDVANVTKEARKYVAGVTFDDFGHVTAIEMGEEADQHIPEYNIVKDTTSEYAATYHLTKDGENVGAAINIPKDMVVEKGEVKELEAGTWGEAGTYIVITLANATDDKLYINVGTLIEYVTSGSATGDMVYVTVDPTTHKITAAITDGTITEAKLHTDVTAKLNKVWQEVGNYQPAGDYKTKQEEKAYAGSTAKTVINVTQNKNGEVEVTYGDIAFPAAPVGAGDVAVATKNEDGSVVLNGSIKLNDHTLEDGANADVTLHKISTTGSIYDVAEGSNAGKNKNGEDILYLVLDCNW